MKHELLAILQTSRNYTLAVAEAMPEASYLFKPDSAGLNFLELMHHIAYSIQWWEENFVKGNQVPWNQPAANKGKNEIISGLDHAYKSLESTIKNLQIGDDAMKGFNATIDHITHHRGQAVVYLRCSNINPPEYVY